MDPLSAAWKAAPGCHPVLRHPLSRIALVIDYRSDMRAVFLLASLAATQCLAADSDFNGRWDIRVPKEPRSRAWWLEVQGAGTPNIRGSFVGFTGGNTDPIPQIAIENGVLHFSADRGKAHLAYTARFVNGKLEGEMHNGNTMLDWTAVRAPEINEHDDGSWKDGKPIALFNGKDLSGWHAMVPGVPLGWIVKNSALSNQPAANNLVSDQKFWNFKIHVEYKVFQDTNSGIGLRGRYEVQILDDYGKPPDTHGNGALYSRILPTMNASKPAGEWQAVDVRLVGRDVTVVLNDHKIIDKKHIDGLTAIAQSPDEGEPGPIILQGDHRHVEIRQVVLTPLVH
jgi:hypothetical protein